LPATAISIGKIAAKLSSLQAFFLRYCTALRYVCGEWHSLRGKWYMRHICLLQSEPAFSLISRQPLIKKNLQIQS